jgi:PAS domain S-box-containing protein
MKLKYKILLYFGTFIFVIVTVFVAVNYFTIERALHKEAKEDLRQMVDSVHAAAVASLNMSIRNYLRGIVEQDLLTLEDLNRRVKNNILTKKQAQDIFQQSVLKRKIGKNGYAAAIKTYGTKKVLDIHPFLRGQDCSATTACRDWVKKKNGYLEYDWKNPKDRSVRKKVAYIRYFKPWDWIIGNTSYKDEFTDLVKSDDLKLFIKPFKVMKNGYFFVMDDKFNMLIHPEIEGENVFNINNKKGKYIARELINNQNSFFFYSWKGKDRFSYVKKLEHFNWYIVASGYMDDITLPIQRLMRFSSILVVMSAIFLTMLTLMFSKSLTQPLNILIDGLNAFYKEKRAYKMSFKAVAEIESVGYAIEDMTKELLDAENDKKIVLKQLNSIINYMPSILIGVDINGRVVFWNEKATKYMGFSREEVFEKHIDDVLTGFEGIIDPIKKSIKSQIPYLDQYQIRSDNKPTMHFEIMLYPLHAGLKSSVLRIDDVTERIQLDEVLVQSQKMDAIGQLAGGVAHDFNNMLSCILNSTNLLELKVKDPNAKKYIDIINDASLRAADLTRNLLTFSRKQVSIPKPVEVHETIEKAVAILSRSMDKSIAIKTELSADNDIVIGDLAKLQSVFINLGINASHAMAEGGELIFRSLNNGFDKGNSVDRSENMKPENYLMLEVEDKGEGISEDHLKTIFDPFFTTKKQGSGTGLGLSSVYGTIKDLKGEITVKSVLGEGTTFKIRLPLSEIKVEKHEQNTELPISGTGTILVIEDESFLRQTTKKMLEEIGYDVIVAENGKDGIEKFKENMGGIGLVLLDMIMPEMGGKECFRILKEIDTDVRVVVVSGFSKEGDLEKMQSEGIANFIHKPFDLKILSSTISRALIQGAKV